MEQNARKIAATIAFMAAIFGGNKAQAQQLEQTNNDKKTNKTEHVVHIDEAPKKGLPKNQIYYQEQVQNTQSSDEKLLYNGINTPYGEIKDIKYVKFYDNGNEKESISYDLSNINLFQNPSFLPQEVKNETNFTSKIRTINKLKHAYALNAIYEQMQQDGQENTQIGAYIKKQKDVLFTNLGITGINNDGGKCDFIFKERTDNSNDIKKTVSLAKSVVNSQR